ncbi:L,D-transpeptidase [Solirhodobacter olei]|uniref:L,D-transpeptidase n=1 Tax=Solirhodobacter olei TaxID=2493082 RepID=UPI000FD6FC77|nr:L,D-transpeptidase [Solirhodobacter olei]
MAGRTIGRRGFLSLGAAAAGLAVPAIARAAETGASAAAGAAAGAPPVNAEVRHNISSFVALDWQPYFPNLKNGAILADTTSRCVRFWSEDQSVKLLYPCSVPTAPELTRKGMTRVVEKVVGPTWHPTPSMLKRMPWLPHVVGPGPENPLGPYALYLSWQYYRVHGTQDTRKIGRRSSDGCIGLYNEDITVLFHHAKVGTQVRII